MRYNRGRAGAYVTGHARTWKTYQVFLYLETKIQRVLQKRLKGLITGSWYAIRDVEDLSFSTMGDDDIRNDRTSNKYAIPGNFIFGSVKRPQASNNTRTYPALSFWL